MLSVISGSHGSPGLVGARNRMELVNRAKPQAENYLPVRPAEPATTFQLQFGSAQPVLQKLDLSGQWHMLPYNDPGWGVNVSRLTELMQKESPTIALPSNWFLMGSKAYPPKATAQLPPLDLREPRDFNQHGLDHAGTVWFSRTFDWAPGRLPVILDLDMVDYYAQVYVNGKKAGQHEGYFQKWSVDVTKHLYPGRNTIALRVTAPSLANDSAGNFPVSWPFKHNQVKGIFGYHDTRPGGTTWRGQERSTGGLIRGIGIRQSSGLDLANVRVTPIEVNTDSARLQIETTVRNWTGKPFKAMSKGEIKPANFEADTRVPIEFEVTAKPGVSKVKTEVKLDHPALWWTWDYGRPNLYQLNLDVRSPKGELLDQQSKKFGVRTLTIDKNWRWQLNGKRIYPRGSNYISTQWLSQADQAWYNRDIRLMKDANMNALRVHGHLERPEFYEAADEAGMLIWQDFPLQWSYTADPSFRKEAVKQAGDMVDRFGSHPSIGLWCMHNEAPHLQNPGIPHHNAKENLALDTALVKKVKALDTSRPIHRDSGAGDSHRYGGWYWPNIKDYEDHAKSVGVERGYCMPEEPCVTEYGAQALPGVNGLKRIFGNVKSVWPLTQDAFKALRSACFQPGPTFNIAKVKPGKSLKEFIANSQQYQANYIRYATETMRRQQGQAPKGTTGLFHFMAVDDAPAITWSVLDYDREPKSGYFALKSAMQPVLPSIAYDVHDPQQPLSLHVVNSLDKEIPQARLEWQIRKGDQTFSKGAQTFNIQPFSVTKIKDLGALPEVTQGDARLEFEIKDAEGKLLSKNTLNAQNFIPHPDSIDENKIMPAKRYSGLWEGS